MFIFPLEINSFLKILVSGKNSKLLVSWNSKRKTWDSGVWRLEWIEFQDAWINFLGSGQDCQLTYSKEDVDTAD